MHISHFLSQDGAAGYLGNIAILLGKTFLKSGYCLAMDYLSSQTAANISASPWLKRVQGGAHQG